MLVKTRLIVLHIDFKDNTHKCLMADDGGLPCKDVLDLHQPIQFGPAILAEYLEIEPEWVTFALVDIEVEEDNTLYVYYTCMIPGILQNRKGQWVEVGNINDDTGNVQKMVYEAGQKLLARF